MRKAACLCLVALAAPTGAQADWRYCLGVDRPGQTVYISDPFPSQLQSDDLDDEFVRDLARSVAARIVVHCPRAEDEEGLREVRLHTAEYSQENGNQVVDTKWRPDHRVAGLP